MKKTFLIVIGWVFTVIGIIGLAVPIMPSMPFFLVAAACFARSSDRFYQMLIQSRWAGEHIRNFREKNALPLRIKMFYLAFLWICLLFSGYFFTDSAIARLIVLALLLVITGWIFSIRTLPEKGADGCK